MRVIIDLEVRSTILFSGITWSRISSSKFAFRFQNKDVLFGDAAPLIVNATVLDLSLLNSKVTPYILSMLNPTLNIFVNDINRIPIIENTNTNLDISKACVEASKAGLGLL